MVRSHPFKLVVAALLLLLAGLAGMWLSILPSYLLSKAADRLAAESGLVLEAERPRLRFHDGLSLEAESVGLESRETDSVSATARLARFSIGWSSLFGRSPVIARAELEAPVITLNVSSARRWGGGLQQLILRDGTLRLKDDTLTSFISLADVNGSWSIAADGAAALQLTYLQDKSLLRLSAEVESAERLFGAGSPADITLTSKDLTMAFSGRAGFTSGLQLDGQLNLEAAGPKPLAQLLGLDLRHLPDQLAMTVQSGLSVSGLSASLKGLQGKAGPATISGQLSLSPGADRIALKGDVASSMLSFWETASPLASGWDESPLPLFDLLAIDGDLTLKADSLLLRGTAVGPATFALASRDGGADLSVKTDAFAGGALAATLQMKRESLSTKLTATGVEAKTAFQALLGLPWLSGPVNLSLDVKGSGESVISLIGSLAGQVSLQSQGLLLDGFDMSHLKSADAAWTWGNGQATRDLALSLQGELSDGILALSESGLEATGLSTKLTGEVDLLRQSLAVGFAPKSRGIADGLSLQGPWQEPILSAKLPTALRPSKDTGKPGQAAAPPAN